MTDDNSRAPRIIKFQPALEIDMEDRQQIANLIREVLAPSEIFKLQSRPHRVKRTGRANIIRFTQDKSAGNDI